MSDMYRRLAEVYSKARTVLMEKGWVQGELSNDKGVCLVGAIGKAISGHSWFLDIGEGIGHECERCVPNYDSWGDFDHIDLCPDHRVGVAARDLLTEIAGEEPEGVNDDPLCTFNAVYDFLYEAELEAKERSMGDPQGQLGI